MLVRSAALRNAVEAYVRAALKRLRKEAGAEVRLIDDLWGEWQAGSAGQFSRWPRPGTHWTLHLAQNREHFHTLPEHAAVVRELRADPAIASQLDTLVGTFLARSRIEADAVADRIVFRMLATNRSTDFDRLLFDDAFAELERDFHSPTVPFTAWAPLRDIASEAFPIELVPGVVLDVLTNDEIIGALRVGIVRPIGDAGFVSFSPPLAGLRLHRELPKLIGERDDGAEVANEFFNWLTGTLDRVVHALRLLQAGTVSTPGIAYASPAVWGAGGMSWVPTPSGQHPMMGRGTFEISAEAAAELRALWSKLARPGVASSRALGIALRRFADAGDRSRPDDQIIDLMIAAEALFLPGERDESAHKLALRAAVFIQGDDRPPRDRFREMKTAYGARSAVAHGASPRRLKFADDSDAGLHDVVEFTTSSMRLGLKKAIDLTSEGKMPGDGPAWDEYVLERLDPSPAVDAEPDA